MIDDLVKKMLDLASFGAFQADLQGNYLYVNKEWEIISGHSFDTVSGTKWLDFIVEEDVPAITTVLRKLVGEQREIVGFKYRIYHPQNGVRYCRTKVKSVVDANQKPLYFIGFVEDITFEVHKAEYIKYQNELLILLKNTQDDFYQNQSASTAFNNLLRELIRITKSEFGFIAEVVYPGHDQLPHFKKLAVLGDEGINGSGEFAAFETDKGFMDMEALSKHFIKNERPYIVNPASKNETKTAIHSFIVLPAKINGQLVGMIGIANRPGGYGSNKTNFLAPLLITFTNLIVFYRLNAQKVISEMIEKDIARHLQTVIESIEDVVIELDGNKVYRNVWARDEKLLFMPKEKIIGKTIEGISGPLAKTFSELVDKVLSTGQMVEFDYKHIGRSVDKWYKARIRPFTINSNLSDYRLVLCIQDITKQTKQEQALKDARERLEQSNRFLDVTQELSKVAGWEFETETGNMVFTKQAHLIYDLPDGFVPTNANTLEFFGAEGSKLLNALAAEAVEKRIPYKIELPINTAKNKKKWIRTIGVPIIQGDEVTGLRGAVLDITEEKEAELTLISTKEKLELSNTGKDRIMHMLAHDLRSPLSGIHSISEIILANKSLSPQDREMVTLIYNSSLSAHIMVNDLIEAFVNDKEVLKKDKEDIQALLQRCVDVQRFRASEKLQEILFFSDGPIFVFIDQIKMERAINNLINNAIKFSPEGAKITLELEVTGNYVQISIKDQGIGIPDELKGEVFDRFGRAKRPGTGGERSFGLGLSFCKEIVEAHEGKIWLESELGKGTTFFITLPNNSPILFKPISKN